jgi:hypothetical protein
MYQQYPQYPQQPGYGYPQYGGCLKFILYLVSFFIPLGGLIIGVIFLSRPDPESKSLGQTCLILGIISILLSCCLGTIFGLAPAFILPFLDSQGYAY